MPKSIICIATYNEIENLPELVSQIFDSVPDTHLLVIDDNSPDGTGQWVQQQSASNPRINCILRSGKLGLGSAVIEAIQFAIENEFELMVNMDADFSHPVSHIPALLKGMEDGTVDVMVASRYAPGGGIEGWPPIRRLMSRSVNAYARLLLRLPTRDCSGSFRCYRVAKLAELNLDDVRSRGYSFFEEILWHLRRSGATFRESPLHFC